MVDVLRTDCGSTGGFKAVGHMLPVAGSTKNQHRNINGIGYRATQFKVVAFKKSISLD